MNSIGIVLNTLAKYAPPSSATQVVTPYINIGLTHRKAITSPAISGFLFLKAHNPHANRAIVEMINNTITLADKFLLVKNSILIGSLSIKESLEYDLKPYSRL